SVQAAVKLLRFAVAVRKSPFVAFSGLRVDPSNLLKARVIITAYNQHVRLLPPEPWSSAHQVYSSVEGADAFMKSSVSRCARSQIRSRSCANKILPVEFLPKRFSLRYVSKPEAGHVPKKFHWSNFFPCDRRLVSEALPASRPR